MRHGQLLYTVMTYLEPRISISVHFFSSQVPMQFDKVWSGVTWIWSNRARCRGKLLAQNLNGMDFHHPHHLFDKRSKSVLANLAFWKMFTFHGRSWYSWKHAQKVQRFYFCHGQWVGKEAKNNSEHLGRSAWNRKVLYYHIVHSPLVGCQSLQSLEIGLN